MKIRRYTEVDIPRMLDHIELGLSITQFKDIHFSREKMGRLLESNISSKLFIAALAVTDDDTIIGGICAAVQQFIFSYEVLAQDYFFYVVPGNRGKGVSTALVEVYVEWAKERGVRRIQLSNSMGMNIERFAQMAVKLGFEQMGTIHQMRV